MKIADLKNCPQWLKDAETVDADVTIEYHRLIWRGGDWRGGTWEGGVWRGGVWHGGDWLGGVWHGGVWHGGYWHGGDWHGGVWRGGVWHGGDWLGGDWLGGDWRGGVWHGGGWLDKRIDRLLFMAALTGVVFRDGTAIAYRTTQADGHGRHNPAFRQPEGEYYEAALPAAGSGTCVQGIHVSSAATACVYFGMDETAQLWEVRFKREDLLDCDGEKCRIRGGVFRKIDRPF